MTFGFLKKKLLTLDRFLNRKDMIKDLCNSVKSYSEECSRELPGEREWILKWQKFDGKVSPLAYRLYYNFIGENINILPCDVSRNYIEPVLNPGGTDGFYGDKNSLGLLLEKEDLPITLFRSMYYKYYDNDYEPVLKDNFLNCFNGFDKLIVKSSKGLGGHSIKLFKRSGKKFFDDENNEMTLDYLESIYKTDFLIQECFIQNNFMSQFNNTSVNTIRVNTYRDVITGEIHFLGAIMRIGKHGSIVDNTSSGGVAIGIDTNGKLANLCIDDFGARTVCFNGIDFSKNSFEIPNYESIKNFSIKISKRFPHISLFALDIAIDIHDNPKIIEVNVNKFTEDFIQRTQGPVFGEYTDSLIDYCISKKDNIKLKLGKDLC